MKSKERRSPGRSSRYDDYDRDSRRRRSRSRSYERYRSRSPSYERHRRRSESPREWVFCFVFLAPLMHIYFSVVFMYESLNKISSDLVGGCMEEEEAGAVRMTGTVWCFWPQCCLFFIYNKKWQVWLERARNGIQQIAGALMELRPLQYSTHIHMYCRMPSLPT